MILAKKRFGQNFLIDPRKADKLVSYLELRPGESVLEIGPGEGALTGRILKEDVNLIAVEIDRELIADLKERHKANKKFNLIEGDIINVKPCQFYNNKFKLIGNLPYNISGAVVEWIIENSNLIERAVVTVQKEVADRLRAKPNTRDYGSFSVIAQSVLKVRKLFDIPPGCFKPKPKVQSAAILIIPDFKLPDDVSWIQFRDFLRQCFAQKRKTLLNSLTSSTNMPKQDVERILRENNLRYNLRAEQLNLDDFISLFYEFKNYES